MNKVPTALLIILDGWGLREEREGNAIAAARTPAMDELNAHAPRAALEAAGTAVGLPEGVMGNSEVGHLTIGAGRVIYQDLMRIGRALESGEMEHNAVLRNAIRQAAENRRTLHLWGLFSDGSVHSHIDHLFGLLAIAARAGAEDIAIHAVLDGRDTPPSSALKYVERLEAELRRLKRGRIATVSGRYYAMDRDRRWERTRRAFEAIVEGNGRPVPNARIAVTTAHEAGQTDEFVEPCVVGEARPMRDGDQIICFNFRADRARQLTAALALTDFNGFERPRRPQVGYVCMTEYDRKFELPVGFPPEDICNTLGEVLSQNGLANLRLAETEKYAHVTYFLNGGVEQPFAREERTLIPSLKVATYDLEPEMKAPQIAEAAEQQISSGRFPVIIMNFANPDMVGHTGKFDAAVRAIETTDAALGRVLAALKKAGGVALITADHGNAEQMIDPTSGEPHTAHTTNLVPLILFDPAYRGRLRTRGTLADVAPTFLGMLGLAAPPEMTGRDLRTS